MLKILIGIVCCAAAITASMYIDHNSVRAIVTGLVSGLMASLVFVILLHDIRPKVDISPVVASGIYKSGAPKLSIKVINHTRADLIQPYAVLHAINSNGPGTRDVVKELKMNTQQPMLIARRNHGKKGQCPNAFVFNIPLDDMQRKIIDEHRGLRFRLIAEHPVSGVKKVFEKNYSSKDLDIREGHFKWGMTFDIIPQSENNQPET